MAYTPISFSAFQTLTAAQMNVLAANDASFADGTGFANDIVKSKHIDWAATGGGDNGGIWWEELGRTTLGVAGDTITVSVAARKYLQIFYAVQGTGGSTQRTFRFNGDTGNNYAYRYSVNGGADTTGTSASSLIVADTSSSTNVIMGRFDVLNIAANEKVLVGQTVLGENTGAGNVPSKWESSGKWVNTSNQITSVTLLNAAAGDFAIGSQVVVLGHN